MSRVAKLILIAPLALAAFALFVALGGEIVKLLWNALLPSIFGWRAITFWEALGLLVLCRILFGGFGLSGSGRSRMRRFDGRWEDRWRERWERLTPEERERLRDGLGVHGGPAPSPGEGAGT